MTNEELCVLVQHGNDKKMYMEQLYLQNKKMIIQIANRYCAYCDLEDLIQEGFFGLQKAAESFDEKNGSSFFTYAYNLIRAVVHRYVEENSNTIRIPSGQRALILKMNRFIDNYVKEHSYEPSIKVLANELDITKEKVRQLVCDSLLLEIKSTNEQIFEDENRYSLEDCIEDKNNHYEKVEADLQNDHLKKILWDIVDSLEPIQRKIIHERYEKNKSLANMSSELDISPAQVRSIEAGAMKELRKQKNTNKLLPFAEDYIYSISVNCVGYHRFSQTWTSSTEKAVLIAEGLN